VGPSDLPKRHGREQRGVEPLGPDGEAFGVGAVTEEVALAGGREQVLVGRGVTANARKAILEDGAGEQLVRDLGDHGASRAVLAREAAVVHRLQAVEMIPHQRTQWRSLWASGPGDAEGHLRRACHTRSPSMERRAYAGPARGLSSWNCVVGHSDATSRVRAQLCLLLPSGRPIGARRGICQSARSRSCREPDNPRPREDVCPRAARMLLSQPAPPRPAHRLLIFPSTHCA